MPTAIPPPASAPEDAPIRPARFADLAGIVALVRELAEYEKSADQVELDEQGLARALFGPDGVATCHVAEVDGEVVGFALWFRTFSTWTGRPGIWLEDLYVRPSARRRGLGRALVRTLAAEAAEAGMARLEWSVLDWNAPARAFYASLGAVAMDEWTIHRLSGPALTDLGTRAAPGTPD